MQWLKWFDKLKSNYFTNAIMNEVGYFTFSYFNTQEQKLDPAGVSGDSDGSQLQQRHTKTP